MANPFQQKAQQRKLVYAALIVALFTVSLLHRKLVIEPSAFELQLREMARGEVELASSAVRLTLTGSRGLAVTFLWSAAIEKQRVNDWNEVELLVASITKLQPYFITPWVFQSWNLSFNVAVECDRPIDKYYYVSRGMELLAEGERRNQGVDTATTKFPGNPDMRHHMGTTYQLKMGTSDEKYTMRCLLDLSCIDPAKRDPDLFWKNNKPDEVEFKNFCRNNPRLLRRLRDHLGCETEEQVVTFLKEAREVPSRFEPRGAAPQTKLKPPNQQFPVLPKREADWPNTESPELGSATEAPDVYMMARTWFHYAQKPLPPPETLLRFKTFKPLEHRIPRHMAIVIFRSTPARAQAFMAETLEEEGWFDGVGWAIPKWFDGQTVVGANDERLKAGPSWEKAYDAYRDYGIKNGMLLNDDQRRKYEADQAKFRSRHGLKQGESIPVRPGDEDEGSFANELLLNSKSNREMTNYDAHLYEAEAERAPAAVAARRIFFDANSERTAGLPAANRKYALATTLWLDVMLQHPNFAQVATIQEDSYEQQLTYLRNVQKQNGQLFRETAMYAAQVMESPHVVGAPIPIRFIPWHDLLSEAQRLKTVPIRAVRGPLDTTQIYHIEHAGEVKDALTIWLQGASRSFPIVFPGQRNLLLTRAPATETSAAPGWYQMIGPAAIQVIRDRLLIK